MKFYTYAKQFSIFFAASSLCLTAAPFASAEEADPYYMQPDTVYELDLDADGQMEQIFYSTWTNEPESGICQAALELSVNSNVIWSVKTETQSYHWDLYRLLLNEEETYFLASCISDNDYTSEILLFTADEEAVTEIAELTSLTRKSEEHPDTPLSAWSRAGAVLDASENTFTLNWCDSFKSTGNIMVPITYAVTQDQVTVKEGPYLLDAEQIWTSWIDFEVQTSPEDASPAYHVSPEETVQLTELLSINGCSYFKCINENGEEGWYADPDGYVSSQTADGSYLMGYFYETIFAG